MIECSGKRKDQTPLARFNQVNILFGVLTWPNEQDIAPETLLAEMRVLESASLPARDDGSGST